MSDTSKNANPNFRAARLLLIVTLVISAAFLAAFYDVSYISDDGAQFVNVARNMMDGNGIATSIVYYDQHYATEQMPAPLSSFPPGYPVLIALVAMVGVSPYLAAFLVSLIFFELTALLIHRAASLSGLPQRFCIGVAIVWLCMPLVWFNILGSLSETSHIALMLASLISLLQGEKARIMRSRVLWFASAGLFAGLAFTIRYLGAFYLISLACILLLRLARRRNRESMVEVGLGLGIPMLFVGALLYRNHVVTSTLHGIYISGVDRSLSEVVRYFCWSVSDIFGFSWLGLSSFGVAELSLVVFLLGSSALLLARQRPFTIERAALLKALLGSQSLLGLIYLAVTVSFFAYWTWATRAGVVNSRYLIPAIPFVLLSGASLLGSLRPAMPVRRLALWGGAAFAVFLIGQANAFNIQWEKLERDSHYAKIRWSLAQPFLSGRLAGFLTEHVPAHEPVLSNSAQSLGAVIDRPVLGLTPAPFSPRVWTEDEVERIVASYGVSYVLFFPTLFDPNDPMNSNQPFLQELDKGNVPAWLDLALESDRVRLYAVNSSALQARNEVQGK